LSSPNSFAARRADPKRYYGDVKVREIIKLIEQDGWQQVRQTGSHRNYRHPSKPGTVTVAGHLRDDLHPKTKRAS
jgi:predicted RNA binding protein YcfA (HicA-like mRNA interferase family)